MKKILIIEDTPAMRDLIKDALELKGYTCFTADDGREGVEAANSHLPDLIICDIHMPNMDGYGVLDAVRKNPTTATIPFIFLTGASDRIDIRRGMELGADDYLTKPFAIHELVAAVGIQFEKQATLQKQSEERLEELRGNITLALPHELRTPLNGILGLASMLIEDFDSLGPDDIKENLRFIQDSAGRLHRLIENFLVYSQIELMAADPEKLPLLTRAESSRFDDAVRHWAMEIAERFDRTGDLVLDAPRAAARVPVDNFKKIATELIDNAFKFSDAGTRVQVTLAQNDDHMRLTVVNSGRGMSAEQIKRIGPHMQFERKFYEQQGAGLGLTLARKLTELHGGRFELESVPNETTTVKITLPA